jgi:zinc protease
MIEAGSAYDGTEPGTASLAAEALLSGPAPAGGRVRQQLERAGVAAEISVGRRQTVVHLKMPPATAIATLGLLASLLARPTLPAEAWAEATARSDMTLAREANDPWLQGNALIEERAWPKGPSPAASRSSFAGTAESERLEEFRRRHYSTRRMVLSVWGAITAEEVQKILPALAALSEGGGELPVVDGLAAPTPGSTPRCLVIPGAEPPVLLLGQPIQIADDNEFYALQVIAHILGQGHFSRLHRALRLEKEIVYTVEASCQPVGPRGLILRVACQTSQLAHAREVILRELRRLAAEAVTAEELATAIAILHSRLLLDAESTRSRIHRRALTLLSRQPVRDPAGAQAALAQLTPEGLRAVARRLLKAQDVSTVVVSARAQPLCSEWQTEEREESAGGAAEGSGR